MATTITPSTFQQLIRRRRQFLKKNQTDVAKAIGVQSPEFIALVEGGQRNIQLERVYKLADALEVKRLSLIKWAMYEQFPMTYRVIFGPHPPNELEEEFNPSPRVEEYCDKLRAIACDNQEVVFKVIDSMMQNAFKH